VIQKNNIMKWNHSQSFSFKHYR